MHTYTFKTVSGGRAKINAGSGFFVPKSNPGIFENSDSVLLNFQNEDDLIIYPANDTVIIDGTTHAAGSMTVTAMSDAINVLFPKANSSSGGTGGASARFGYPGEDVTSDVDRDMDMQTHKLEISNGQLHLLSASVKVDNGYIESSSNDNSSKITIFGQDGLISIKRPNGSLNILADNLVGAGGTAPVLQLPNAAGGSVSTIPLSVNGQFADATGDIALVPTQSFDSNAEAVAALGVGKLYKSTTLINGSPIILITV